MNIMITANVYRMNSICLQNEIIKINNNIVVNIICSICWRPKPKLDFVLIGFNLMIGLEIPLSSDVMLSLFAK